MSDNDKPKLGMRAPLGVRRTVETGKVKQSFSHGRSNTVIVETKKARVLRRPGDPAPAHEPEVLAAGYFDEHWRFGRTWIEPRALPIAP